MKTQFNHIAQTAQKVTRKPQPQVAARKPVTTTAEKMGFKI